MKGTHNTYLESERGQTMVEFALIVALFLAIIFGILEFGRAWFYSNHLANSVRATARYAAVLNNTTSMGTLIDTYARNEIGEFMPTDDIDSITIRYYPEGSGSPSTDFAAIEHGDTIEVSVTYNFHVLSGSIIPFFSGDRQLTRTASMPYE